MEHISLAGLVLRASVAEVLLKDSDDKNQLIDALARMQDLHDFQQMYENNTMALSFAQYAIDYGLKIG